MVYTFVIKRLLCFLQFDYKTFANFRFCLFTVSSNEHGWFSKCIVPISTFKFSISISCRRLIGDGGFVKLKVLWKAAYEWRCESKRRLESYLSIVKCLNNIQGLGYYYSSIKCLRLSQNCTIPGSRERFCSTTLRQKVRRRPVYIRLKVRAWMCSRVNELAQLIPLMAVAVNRLVLG